ncbi:hypothetical protein [Nocardia sp. NBC_01009]|uniref:hypothetical protein n=1 Tax=Nocardia sp. NBC_01009 TaxID=2975996 RepID=UPI00386524A5|nr:hypothetical protein OHA42_01815 [Nocardia sp. NBC_01009]
MRRIGNAVDTTTAFLGAAVAGVSLLLPITFTWTGQSTQYRLTSLINSVPRGAAIGVIVAVAVAVLVTTFTRPVAAWATALGGALGMFVNHFAGRHVSSPDMLTTQNYLDSVCAGILLGALGAAVLRRPGPAIGFALGGAGSFVAGNLADLLNITAQDPLEVLETPPRWLIAAAVGLLLLSTYHNRSRPMAERSPRLAVELPVTPILAAMVLALVVLMVTEWLNRQYQDAPNVSHAVDIGLAVTATALAAMAAAMLLPGRDGVGVYLAVSLVPVFTALGYAARPGWGVLALLVITAVGLFIGTRLPSAFIAITMIAGLAVFAIYNGSSDINVVDAAGSAGLALTTGYCCGTARPRYAPSGVLAIAALYLPSIITAVELRPDGATKASTPGGTALAIVACSAVGIAVLYFFRPRGRPQSDKPAEGETLADI